MARPPIEVTILGTSSAVPTTRRGLSGTALVREGETVLFDCGEGTQFRMLQAQIPRRKLNHVFISHLHGDHIFGIGGLISSLNLAQRDFPLHFWGPTGLERFVRFMVGFPRPTRLGFELQVHEFRPGHQGCIYENEEWEMHTLPLDHRLPAMGYRFQEKTLPGRFDGARADALGVPFGPERGTLLRGEAITLADGRRVGPEDLVGPERPGRSVVYCTDTAYTEKARVLAHDADLLIHEATYGDEFIDLAEDRKHSTIRQAATIARDAGARQFVATHFSTRYELPAMLRRLEKEGREVYPTLIMAEDLTTVAVEDRPEA